MWMVHILQKTPNIFLCNSNENIQYDGITVRNNIQNMRNNKKNNEGKDENHLIKD